jgi:hypothetical protein
MRIVKECERRYSERTSTSAKAARANEGEKRFGCTRAQENRDTPTSKAYFGGLCAVLLADGLVHLHTNVQSLCFVIEVDGAGGTTLGEEHVKVGTSALGQSLPKDTPERSNMRESHQGQ